MLLRQFFRIGVPEISINPRVGPASKPYSMPLWTILTKMAGAADRSECSHRSAVLPVILSAPRRALDIPTPWCQGFEDGGEMRHGSSDPPIIMQTAIDPQMPPLVPTST